MQTFQKIRSGLVTVAILLWAGLAQAEGTLTPIPYLTIVDANGATVSGACIWTYTAGTSTPATTWTDKALTAPNTNPVVANGNGQAVLYLSPGSSYKYVVETACTSPAHGTTIRTQDNIDAVPASAATLDVSGTAGETLTALQAVYLSDGSGGKTAGLWYKADTANPYSSTTPLIGVVPANIAAAAIGSIRIGGEVPGFSSLTVGATYYITTAGAITVSVTTGPRLGQAKSTTALIVAPTNVFPLPVTTAKTTNYTAVARDFVLATGTFTVTLPAAASNTNVVIDVKNVSTGTVTIGRTGADTIDGATTQSLSVQYQSMTFISDGTNWWIR